MLTRCSASTRKGSDRGNPRSTIMHCMQHIHTHSNGTTAPLERHNSTCSSRCKQFTHSNGTTAPSRIMCWLPNIVTDCYSCALLPKMLKGLLFVAAATPHALQSVAAAAAAGSCGGGGQPACITPNLIGARLAHELFYLDAENQTQKYRILCVYAIPLCRSMPQTPFVNPPAIARSPLCPLT